MGRDEALTWAETQNPLEEQAEASRLWPGLFQTSGTPSPAGVHCPLPCLTADHLAKPLMPILSLLPSARLVLPWPHPQPPMQ